ncbi:MAG: YitT family protein [Clostridia bacterium]|nr:YitT family protein [Clostridia bacterium]
MGKKVFFREIVYTVLGTFISAFAIVGFLLPNKLSSGGFTGIATILFYFFSFPVGTTVIIMNIPLFILAYVKSGRKFLLKTILGTVSLSIFIDLLQGITAFTDDRFLAAIYGGILNGIGESLIFKVQNATGGSDLIVQIIQKYSKRVSKSNLLIGIDGFIVLLNLVVFGEIEIGLYSAITIYIVGKVVDIVFEGINFSKMIYIISNNSEEISTQIGSIVRKGSTGLYGKGMYYNKDKLVLICVVKRREIVKVKEIVNSVDPNAFLIISDAREVYGLGFKEE